MDIADAFTLLLELARESVLPLRDAIAPELLRERARQLDALNMVEDFIVNQLGDD